MGPRATGLWFGMVRVAIDPLGALVERGAGECSVQCVQHVARVNLGGKLNSRPGASSPIHTQDV